MKDLTPRFYDVACHSQCSNSHNRLRHAGQSSRDLLEPMGVGAMRIRRGWLTSKLTSRSLAGGLC